MTGFLPEEFFERTERVPLSKPPVRAMVASLMWPLDGAIVGESGTGSGGITVELAQRVGSGRIYSCDPSDKAIRTAGINLRKGALLDRVTLIKGGAPQAFDVMPPLDRLIVGGHGGDLRAIILSGVEKLKEGGRIVITANMPSSAMTAMNALEDISLSPEMWHINVSRSKRIKTDWMMNSYNPTFIVWADKGEIES